LEDHLDNKIAEHNGGYLRFTGAGPDHGKSRPSDGTRANPEFAPVAEGGAAGAAQHPGLLLSPAQSGPPMTAV